MFYQIFLSPQVKRCAIITYKYGTCYLPNELPNDLRLYAIYTILTPRHFRRWGGQSAHTRKKKKTICIGNNQLMGGSKPDHEGISLLIDF